MLGIATFALTVAAFAQRSEVSRSQVRASLWRSQGSRSVLRSGGLKVSRSVLAAMSGDYKYVEYRPPGNVSRIAPGYYARNPEHRDGPFETSLQAAKRIAKLIGVSVASLKKKPTARPRSAVSPYDFVTKRTIKDHIYWVGQPSKGTQKLFTSLSEAGDWVAAERGVDKKDLNKTKQQFTWPELGRRLAVITTTYDDGKELPGDLEDLLKHAKQRAKDFAAEPTIELLVAQGKYGPFRSSLLRMTKKSRSSSPSGPRSKVHRPKADSPKVQKMLRSKVMQPYSADVANRAVAIFNILCDTLEDLDGTDFSEWTNNCGRNVSYHSGFVPLCRRLHVLKSKSFRSGGLRLSSAKWQYKLRDISTSALTRVCRIIQLADALHAQVENTKLRTCTDWCSAFDKCMNIASTEAVPSFGMGYTAKWTIRCMLLTRLSRHGRQLAPGRCTWSDFCKAGPDQTGNLPKLAGYKNWRRKERASGTRTTLVKHILKEVDYHGAPELVSMYLCFLNGVGQYNTESLESHVEEMSTYRREYKRTRGQNPIFTDVVKQCINNPAAK